MSRQLTRRRFLIKSGKMAAMAGAVAMGDALDTTFGEVQPLANRMEDIAYEKVKKYFGMPEPGEDAVVGGELTQEKKSLLGEAISTLGKSSSLGDNLNACIYGMEYARVADGDYGKVIGHLDVALTKASEEGDKSKINAWKALALQARGEDREAIKLAGLVLDSNIRDGIESLPARIVMANRTKMSVKKQRSVGYGIYEVLVTNLEGIEYWEGTLPSHLERDSSTGEYSITLGGAESYLLEHQNHPEAIVRGGGQVNQVERTLGVVTALRQLRGGYDLVEKSLDKHLKPDIRNIL